MATVVPRSKKRRTSNEISAGPSNGQSASASVARNHKGIQSVNEVIGGKLQEVFVVDSDDDAPPSRPLAADLPPRARPSRIKGVNGVDATSTSAAVNGNGNGGMSRHTRSSKNGTATEAAIPATASSSKPKGKRKANGSLSASESVGLDSNTNVGATTSTTTSKRRKKDHNDININTITSSASAAARSQAAAAIAAQQSRAGQLHAQALLHHHQQQQQQQQQPPQNQFNQLYRQNAPSGSGYVADQQQQLGWGSGSRYVNGSASYSEGIGSDSRNSQQSHYGPPSPPPGLPVDDKEGHFIVRTGDYVSPRYKILSQLGQGTFGKVVECYDRETKQYVAIKIIRAIQKYRDASQIEIRVLKTLREHDPSNDNKCIHLLDTFSHRNHVCIVSELLGKSVFDFLKENDFAAFPPQHIWSFAQQLLKSVAFLHRLNLVHTDLKPENILLVDSAYTIISSSKRPNSKKKKVLTNSEIRLIDFGSATFNNEYHSAVVSTRHYRAPEIILNMGWSFPCDAWSIGCILVEFYTGDALFQTHDNLEHLAMMEAVLGSMPEDYRRKAETYKPELFRGGSLDYPNSQTPKTSRRYVRGMKRLHEILPSIQSTTTYSKHHRCFLNLIRRLLEFDPTKRISVQEALSHDYFRLQEHEIPP